MDLSLSCPVAGAVAFIAVGGIRQVVPAAFVGWVIVIILSSIFLLFVYFLTRLTLFRCPRCEGYFSHPNPNWFGFIGFGHPKCVHCGLKEYERA